MSIAQPKLRKPIYGIGINDYPDSISINGKNILSYSIWQNMLERCYSEECHSRYPTYIGCSVHPDWIYYSNFKKWYDINYREGYQLDKDILVQGNKVYGPNTCCYVPGYINSLMLKMPKGKYQSGVVYYPSYKSRPYRAQCRIHGKQKYFGYFATDVEAHQRYIEIKTAHIKDVATQAYASGEISHQVYAALLNWKVT